jgi:hypothetical protein
MLQIGSAGTRATAFQGACLSVANSTAFVEYHDLPDSSKELCVLAIFKHLLLFLPFLLRLH